MLSEKLSQRSLNVDRKVNILLMLLLCIASEKLYFPINGTKIHIKRVNFIARLVALELCLTPKRELRLIWPVQSSVNYPNKLHLYKCKRIADNNLAINQCTDCNQITVPIRVIVLSFHADNYWMFFVHKFFS